MGAWLLFAILFSVVVHVNQQRQKRQAFRNWTSDYKRLPEEGRDWLACKHCDHTDSIFLVFPTIPWHLGRCCEGRGRQEGSAFFTENLSNNKTHSVGPFLFSPQLAMLTDVSDDVLINSGEDLSSSPAPPLGHYSTVLSTSHNAWHITDMNYRESANMRNNIELPLPPQFFCLFLLI